ncbi:MAG: hypothetical protein FWH42_03425 [Dehalococcoidia bacterium]|nr:hypothetical protein [Dehalococcoidia bacterium]
MKKVRIILPVFGLLTLAIFTHSVTAAEDDYVGTSTNGNAGVALVLLSALLVGLAITLIVIRVMAGKMSTVRKQGQAKQYEKGLELTKKADVYLYSHTTSHQIQSSRQ